MSLSDERKQGLGALMGFATGLAGGAALGVLRPVPHIAYGLGAVLTFDALDG